MSSDGDQQQAIHTHQPCEDCGSSDALSVYPDHTYCFSCDTLRRTEELDTSSLPKGGNTGGALRPVTFKSLPKRGLTEETCRKWSYGVTQGKTEVVQVAQYLDNNRRVVAQKMRTPDKKFPWKNRSSFKGLYGQWLWRDGGKMVVITEGELDALSVSQAQGNKWPVVSLPDGGGKGALKPIKEALAWLNKFDKIVLFFDNDDPGRETVDHVKKILPVGKVAITYAPEGYKDASDLLQAGKGRAIVDCIWGAKDYRPDGLVSGWDLIKRLKNRPEVVAYEYPPDIMPVLNEKARGIRLGELDVWTSGTGMGKTTLIKALQNHYFHSTPFNQALVHLEEPLEDTGDDLIAYEAGNRFTVDDTKFKNTPEYDEIAERLFVSEDSNGKRRFQLYDAFGSVDDTNLFEIIRFAATAEDCLIVWVDHLSILVSDLDTNDDERRRIDKIMHGLKELTVELGIYIGLISHLRKPPGQGKSFEEGHTPSLDDLRGSGGIKQLANSVFAISRDQQADNELERNTSQITVLKCRKTGRTGPADYVRFDETTGRLTKGTAPSLSDGFQDESDGEY